MRKNLIALAALAASGIASAQSSVTIFGAVDLSYESIKTNAGRISGITPSSWRSAKFGFRGTEDLGGGMAAGFWIEAGLNPANGSGLTTSVNNQSGTTNNGGMLFNRRSIVSLSGNFGELRVGRDYTPSYNNYWLYDPFGNAGVGASLTAYSGVFEASTFVRASNSIGYSLPGNLGGFFGEAMYAFGNRASNETQAVPAAYGTSPVNTSDNGRYMGAKLGYGLGPWVTSVAFARTTYAPGTRNATIFELAPIPYGKLTDVSWGGSYNFGTVKAMALLARHTMSDATTPGNKAVEKTWGIGVDWNVGPGNVLASYSRATLTTGALATEPRASKLAVGYVHNLSKRTSLYAMYARVGNGGGAAQSAASLTSGLGDVAGGANINGRSTGLELGISHAF
jgi:predicted porin